METFLFKSTVAMAALLGLYYLLFEREKMHRFNRFYLISALALSLALPFITVITYVQEIKVSTGQPLVTPGSAVILPSEEPTNYWFYIGWGIYAIITLVLIIRFAKNIVFFFRKASANPSVKMKDATLVLLEEKVLPHTFLNYIFVNREEYEANLIQKELYTHEYTHVQQKHTIDILCIEVLKTIFWFNPLLYCYKIAIQLNHEFLADEKVIDTTANTVYYQNLLLEKATVGTTFSMASNLTFSLTKKRFLMMTKTTSTKKAGFLKAAIIPVFTALLMLLCSETIAQVNPKPATDAETQARIDKMVVSDSAMDSLRAANPDMFSSDLNIRYKNTKFSFTHKDGTVTEVIGYKSLNEKQKKLVSYAPEMYGMDMEFKDDEETASNSVAPTTIKEAVKDPSILLKKTKFKFTDKEGKTTLKTGYKTLTEDEKKKIAPILPSLSNTDVIEYNETENGTHLHQEPLVNYKELTSTPTYPGGLGAFNSYFAKSFSIPKIASGLYRVYMAFTVEKDGSLTDIKCLRGDKNLIDEATRVIEKSEKWIPAQKDGVPVRAIYNIPLTINVK